MSSLGLFERLPRELRDCVYGHVLHEHDWVHQEPRARLHDLLTKCPLMRSSKIIRKDVLESWVSQGTFITSSTCSNSEVLTQFLHELERIGVDVRIHMPKRLGNRWCFFPIDYKTQLERFKLFCQRYKEIHERCKVTRRRLLTDVRYWVAVPSYSWYFSKGVLSWKHARIRIVIRMGDKEASMRELDSAYTKASVDLGIELERLAFETKSLERYEDIKLPKSKCENSENLLDGLGDMREVHTGLIEDMVACWCRPEEHKVQDSLLRPDVKD